ncbi:MAG: 4-(cytidine 5'-diphospho)-2-C-methyl-D-erythritol kinase [Nitrospirota bacterium]
MVENSSLVTRRSSLSMSAPAKINWFLTINGKREDGYHDINSLMQSISLYDDLAFERSDRIEVISDLDIPPENNLVYKAAAILKGFSSSKEGARITVKKNIPVSAGLGGGSSDAAYTLLGLNRLWGLGLKNPELIGIGQEIGSDVPFFLNGPLAFISGRGEKIRTIKINSSLEFLLVKPPISISTSWAYKTYDGKNTGELTKNPVDIKLFCRALQRKDFASLSLMIKNDLESVVFEGYPVVEDIKVRLLKEGAKISSMSGSGPTVFAVFDSYNIAESAARSMKSFIPGAWCMLVKTIT